MKTELLKADKNSIKKAAKLLKEGKVVAVPTETVYGLAGDCTKSQTILDIFKAKGRPQDNPLIVHIASLDMLDGIVKTVPEDAKLLADAFWPGPLTIIMPKGDKVCDESTAGLDSVGVRMPSHPVAREIIKLSGVAFSAPSANTSGKPSPTNAQDVFDDMNGKIPLIIDGGECNAGVESTVVSVLEDTPIILRPGVISKEDMQKVLGKKVKIAREVTKGVKKDQVVRSPGMKYKHYAPACEVTLVKGSFKAFKEFVDSNKQEGLYVMCFDGEEKYFDIPSISYGKKSDPLSQAHNLFTVLRKLDKMGAKSVYARCPKSSGVSLAVYNRLIRSAGFKVIDLSKTK